MKFTFILPSLTSLKQVSFIHILPPILSPAIPILADFANIRIMKLSIIIVSWNVGDLLNQCLSSIFKQLQNINFEVFVVDNASQDNSVELVSQQFSQVKLIINKNNAGFARANNQAIKQSCGEYILLLNPDTQLIDSSLIDLIKFVEQKKDAAIVGPKLLYPDKSTQASVRRLPSFWDQFFILLKLHNFFPYLGPLKKYHMLDFAYDKVSEVDQTMGAAMLIRREVFDKVGLFDEKFWAIFEEVDFCQRAKAAGFKIYFNPIARSSTTKASHFPSIKFYPSKSTSTTIYFIILKNISLSTSYFCSGCSSRLVYFWR